MSRRSVQEQGVEPVGGAAFGLRGPGASANGGAAKRPAGAPNRCSRLALGALVSLALASLALLGCSDEPEGPAPDLVGDLSRVRALMNDDPADAPLLEVDRVVDDRPVLASEMLGSAALPAARRQLQRAEALELGTAEGRSVGQHLVSAYRARVAALEQYRAVLAGGPNAPDEALLAGLGAMSDAQLAIVAVDREMESLAPTEAPAPPAPVGGPLVDEELEVPGTAGRPRR